VISWYNRAPTMLAQKLCLAVAVAVALWCGGVAASAAGPPPPVVKGGGKTGKFVTLTSKNSLGHKRNYQVTCVDKNNPAGCYVGCPAKRCPNQCIVFCTYCLSFCGIV
jgi:hypothetical protein